MSSTSTTNSWPSRRSCSKTPWKPRPRHAGQPDAVASDAAHARAAVPPQGLDDVERVDRRDDVVHPHAPDAVPRDVHGGGGGDDVALQGRAAVVGGAARRRRGRSCATCRRRPGGPGATISSRRRSSSQLCSARLANPKPGSSRTASGLDPGRRPAPRRARSARARRRRRRRRSGPGACMSRLWPRQCIATNGTDRSATRAGISGSARPPLTSLTREAPASSAAAATSARIVSIDTGARVAQRLDDGDDAAQLLGGARPLGTGPGGLATDVEQVGALGDELAAVRDRGLGREPGTAVAERVGGDVDDAHDERAPGPGFRQGHRPVTACRRAAATSPRRGWRGRAAGRARRR